ncbi:MAG: hypothetical protein NZM38_01970 [Cytophagales bacterium]|nr:hypothetical protein [Cytophagales bacterium]MDW8383520.1 hypothetical protein [Flammeovirgaceae bacterium]
MQPLQALVYQAYGQEAILYEALFSIYSFLRYNTKEPTFVFIYTDQIEFFIKKLPTYCNIHFVELSQKQIQQWQGSYGFVHRLKIELLKDFCSRLCESTAILYVDTDTVFRQSPQVLYDKIQQGFLLMHQAEGTLQSEHNPILKKTNRFFKNKSFLIDNTNIKVSPQTMMYNAGVLGFLAKETSLLERILAFTDEIYPLFRKHIVEQLAFSFFFQQHQIQTTSNEILHYWNFKEFRSVLKEFFEHFKNFSPEEIMRLSWNFSVENLQRPKLLYESKPKWVRFLYKITGNTWKMPPYKFWEK